MVNLDAVSEESSVQAEKALNKDKLNNCNGTVIENFRPKESTEDILSSLKELKATHFTQGALLKNSRHGEAVIQPPTAFSKDFPNKLSSDPYTSSEHLDLSRQCCEHIHSPGTPQPDGTCCYHRCRPSWTLEERERHYGKEVFK